MRSLTQDELSVLPQELNLADAHAYRGWSEAETAILASSARLFKSVDRRQQEKLESDFVESFFTAARQTFPARDFSHFLCFTASAAIEVVANYLRMYGLS